MDDLISKLRDPDWVSVHTHSRGTKFFLAGSAVQTMREAAERIEALEAQIAYYVTAAVQSSSSA